MSINLDQLAYTAIHNEGTDAYFGATVEDLALFLALRPDLWKWAGPDGGTSWLSLPGFDRALRAFVARQPQPQGEAARALPLSLTDADIDAIREVVAEELASHAEQLHGDLDDPTDGPLDQAALRRHGDAVDLVRQDTQAHCMACGHKGEVAS